MMSETRAEALVGAVVLAVAAGFLIYAGQVAGVETRRTPGYDLSASFRSAEGVSVGTDVRLAGVKIGSVAGMVLNRDTYRAEVMMRVSDAVKIPEDSTAAVSAEGLLGGTFVEIIPGGSPFVLEAGGEFTDTQGSVSLVGLMSRFVSSAASE
jgi:phospholipid/cholesterol/gamma-HCH transport system substrate-binding protein